MDLIKLRRCLEQTLATCIAVNEARFTPLAEGANLPLALKTLREAIGEGKFFSVGVDVHYHHDDSTEVEWHVYVSADNGGKVYKSKTLADTVNQVLAALKPKPELPEQSVDETVEALTAKPTLEF